jgi:hypothetical protein
VIPKAVAVIVCGVVSMSAVISSAPRKRSIEMEITLPNGAVARAATTEEEGVIVKLVDGRRFGFVPILPHGNDVVAMVGIWDVDRKPVQKLGSVNVEVGGVIVHSDTSPSFGLRVARVIEPK